MWAPIEEAPRKTILVKQGNRYFFAARDFRGFWVTVPEERRIDTPECFWRTDGYDRPGETCPPRADAL